MLLFVAHLKKVLSHLARKEKSTSVVTVVGIGTVATGAQLKNRSAHSSLLIWKIVLISTCSFEKYCSTKLAQLIKSAHLRFLLIWKKSTHPRWSSVLVYKHLLSPLWSLSFKSKICLACPQIYTHLPCSSDKKCSTGLLIWKASTHLPFTSGKMCSSELLI